MQTLKRHIIIIGPSGVGKTTVGRIAAERIGVDFVDLDEFISKKINQPISEYFATNGEEKFREIETQSLTEVCERKDPMVLACGGGTPLRSQNIIEMQKHGYVIYLSAFEKDIIQRVNNDDNDRPLLSGDLEEKVHQQLKTRKAIYELANDITIATSGRDVDTVVDALIRQFKRESGQSNSFKSSIVVGSDVISQISKYIGEYNQYILVSDPGVPSEFKDKIKNSIGEEKILYCEIEQGENGKSFDSYCKVIQEMASNKITRNSCVIALGGGVVGDLSGFVASTYHRGVDVIQVPTTLLAQVDSSIGGKCGINLESGKNLVGSFHQPKLIVADISTLKTLSDEDYLSGLGEVAKYALLGNSFVEDLILEKHIEILKREDSALVPLIRHCMNHKVQIVSRDPHERNGIRATLNLGHTLAHAIETLTKYQIPHGVAVVLGLRFIAELSCELGRIPSSQAQSTNKLLDVLGLTSKWPVSKADIDYLIEVMRSDKKSLGQLSFIVMNSDGTSELIHDVDEKLVRTTLEKILPAS